MYRRSLFIDAAGARVLTPDEEQRLSQVSLLGDYLAGKRKELLAWNEALGPVAELSANRRKLTNISTFRAFALAYLKNHPNVHPNMTCMVRQRQTTVGWAGC